jgi:hypothetical protein
MKKIFLGMAAISALAVGAPAAAQQYPGSYQNNGYQNGYQNNGYQNGYGVNGSLDARSGSSKRGFKPEFSRARSAARKQCRFASSCAS